jgi:hypothetical protein
MGVVGAVLGHLITDVFMTAETTSSWLFWLLMGAGLGLASRVLATRCRGHADANDVRCLTGLSTSL